MNNISSRKSGTLNNSKKSLSTGGTNDRVVESMLPFFAKTQAKEVSLYARKLCCKRTSQRGSLTLEAAIILPIFTCFIVSILFFFRVVECELALEKSMDYAARQTASVMDGDSFMSGGPAWAFMTAYNRAKESRDASDYPQWPAMQVFAYTSGEDLVIDSACEFSLPLPLIGTKNLFVKQQVRSREWVGYTGGGGGLDNAEETVVYVVANPDVYHLARNCTYLDPQADPISASEIESARSKGGSKYTPCSYCKPTPGSGTYYIPPHGTKYHSTLSCSRLHRVVYTRYLSEVEGVMPPCSKCGGG